MSGVGRRRIKRSLDHLGHAIVLYGPRPSRAGLVQQAINAIGDETPAPLADSMFMDAQFRRHGLARQPLGAAQDHAATLRKRTPNPMTPYLALKIGPFIVAQNQGRNRPTGALCHRNKPLRSIR